MEARSSYLTHHINAAHKSSSGLWGGVSHEYVANRP
jgi:hypothetical protein